MGASFVFDGTGDAISYGDVTWYDGASSGSIACWIYPTSLPGTEMKFLSKWSDSGLSQTFLFSIDASNKFQGVVHDNVTFRIVLGGTASTNTWFHVCMTFATNSQILYINGSSVSSDTNYNGSLLNSSAPLYFGAGHNSGPAQGFIGNIAGVRFFDRQISSSEVLDIMKKYNYNNGETHRFLLNDSNAADSQSNSITGTLLGNAQLSNIGPPIFFPTLRS